MLWDILILKIFTENFVISLIGKIFIVFMSRDFDNFLSEIP